MAPEETIVMMNKVEKYIIKTVLQSIIMIFACLVALQLFILFVNQLGDIGKGNYTFGVVIKFVLLRLPYELSMCFPVICLLGSLVGLSILANNSELVILRANGLSILNILRIVATAGIGLIIVVMLIFECFVPKMMFKANTIKLEAMNEGIIYRQARSVWFHNLDNFWFIQGHTTPFQLLQVTLFQKDSSGVLKSIEYYEQVNWQQGSWYVNHSDKTFFQQDKVGHLIQDERQKLELPLTPKFFRHVEQNPDEMSLFNLWSRLRQLKKQQNIAKDELIFWQRLLQPANTLLMMLLSIPCIFGPLRSVTMGARLIAGIALGFGFYILNQMFGFVSQVYQVAPILGATMPIMLFGILGGMLLLRTR